jgi:PAS domain S-box-containing protein
MAYTGCSAVADTDPQVLRSALNATRLLIMIVDNAGVVREVNRAVEHAAGPSLTLCDRPIWELAALAGERTLLQAAFSQARVDALPRNSMFHLISSVGPPRVVDWNIRALPDASAGPIVVLTGIDLTDRLTAEQQLRETESLQHLILDRLPAIIWTTDRELRFTFSAGGGLSSLRLESGQVAFAGTSLFSYFHTSDPHHPGIAPHLRALEGHSAISQVLWFDRLFESRIEPLRNQHDEIVGCIGLALDVTEQARTAEALRTSEAQLRRLVEANVIGIIFWDEAGRITEANEAFLGLVGFTRDQLVSGAVSWRELTPSEYRLVDNRALAEINETGRCTPYEKEYVAKDGTRVPVLVGAVRLDTSPEGSATGIAFILDLREQTRLRQARDQLLIKEQSARIETELANARLLLLVEGSKRLSRTMNAADTLDTLAALVVPALADWSYVVHLGWDGGPVLVASAHGDPNKQELLRSLHSCTPEPTAPEGAPRVFRTGEVALYDAISTDQLSPSPPGWPIVGTRDPKHLHTLRELGMKSLMCVPIHGRGRVDAVMMLVSADNPHRYDHDDVVLAQDLAGRAAASLENGRLLSEALDSVRARDDFLAVAAHELRTPLTSLLLQLQILDRAVGRERSEPESMMSRSVSAAENQARRLSTLIDHLLDVARVAGNRLGIRVEGMDLRQLMEGILTALAPDLERAGCRIAVSMPAEVTGRWDRMRIEQVLTNLLSNAMKFGAGRPIEVNVEADAENVRISVRDHGIGISHEDQTRIFGRFERAVSSRHFGGLGLGLYITVQILRAHQGSLRVESEPGQGSCFIVDLPRGLRSAKASEVASAPS